MTETWDVWYPHAGATGMSFCRSRVDPAAAGERLLIHAAPEVISVTVRDEDGNVVAEGSELRRGAEGPMSALVRRDGTVSLEERWPDESDVGRLVLLPGGEAGILRSWWHADDHTEWRWTVEFHNSR